MPGPEGAEPEVPGAEMPGPEGAEPEVPGPEGARPEVPGAERVKTEQSTAEPAKAPLMLAEAELLPQARDGHRQLAPRSRPLPDRAPWQPLLSGPRSSPFHIR